MKALTKYLAGAAAAAALTVSAAAPAEAQWRDRRDRDGIDAGDIITGVAVVGGIAAILGALDNDGNRYGYDAGHACIAVAGPIELSAVIETRTGNRELNMWSFASAALDLLVKALQQAGGAAAGTRNA